MVEHLSQSVEHVNLDLRVESEPSTGYGDYLEILKNNNNKWMGGFLCFVLVELEWRKEQKLWQRFGPVAFLSFLDCFIELGFFFPPA